MDDQRGMIIGAFINAGLSVLEQDIIALLVSAYAYRLATI
jgi:hypothetical protein